jgi:hypothetical protein
MHNHINIHKKQLFRCGKVQGFLDGLAACRRRQRLASTRLAGIDIGELPEHLRGHNPHGSIEALLQECLGCRPSLVDKAVEDRARETRPDVLSALPTILLEVRSKVRVAEPQDVEVSLILLGVLRQPHTVQILRVEPVHIRVRIPRVTRPSIHFTPINRPKIRNNVKVMLGDIPVSVLIEDTGYKIRFHYSRVRSISVLRNASFFVVYTEFSSSLIEAHLDSDVVHADSLGG